ncbi:hypothetical protein NA57DRAFT_47271, partial [Rhizodiscina lignyota]
MLTRIAAVVIFAALGSANFQLNFPESTGYDAQTESTGPCGGVAVNLQMSNMTFFDVDGASIYVTSEHQITDYLFRATLDNSLEKGWTDVFPVIQQHGIGDFCLPSVSMPSNFNGQTGVFQVIANTSTGMFFQCAVVMFQPGKAKPQGACRNGSSVFAEYITNDVSLNSIARQSSETFMSSSMSTSTSALASSMSSMSGMSI